MGVLERAFLNCSILQQFARLEFAGSATLVQQQNIAKTTQNSLRTLQQILVSRQYHDVSYSIITCQPILTVQNLL